MNRVSHIDWSANLLPPPLWGRGGEGGALTYPGAGLRLTSLGLRDPPP
jgi:hypothetical protein